MSGAASHQAVAREALSVPWSDFWTRRERTFLTDMTGGRRCSPAQRNWLDRLASRAREARRVEGR